LRGSERNFTLLFPATKKYYETRKGGASTFTSFAYLVNYLLLLPITESQANVLFPPPFLPSLILFFLLASNLILCCISLMKYNTQCQEKVNYPKRGDQQFQFADCFASCGKSRARVPPGFMILWGSRCRLITRSSAI